MLTPKDISDLTAFRMELHRAPEISGFEERTAKTIAHHLEDSGPDEIVTGLGGHGVAARYSGSASGRRLLFRCELDALPIQETPRAHQSAREGWAHLCGHDGHMAILMGLAQLLKTKPARGEVILLFQPAEETGEGGPAVVNDPKFASIKPDMAFSLHNMPGLPLGYVGISPGPAASASRGIAIHLTGHEGHSAYPETAAPPTPAMAHLMSELPKLSIDDPDTFRRVTVTHASLGQPNFGITPGKGVVMATLRTRLNADMDDLIDASEALVANAAKTHGLTFEIGYHEVFEHLENAPEAVETIETALKNLNIPFGIDGSTMAPSEDFAALSHVAPSAMFYLGSGEHHPALHRPDYDFPDALIPIGASIFDRIIRQTLG